MILKLNDKFLDQYHIKGISYYNDNYYKLPFSINCDGEDCYILHIVYDQHTNEYEYGLCYELEDGEIVDNIFIAPTPANGIYELNLEDWSKDMRWY